MTPTSSVSLSDIIIGGGFILLVLVILIGWLWMFFNCLTRPGWSFPKENGKLRLLWLLLVLLIPFGFLFYFFRVYLPGRRKDYPAQRLIRASSAVGFVAYISIFVGVVLIAVNIFSRSQVQLDTSIGIYAVLWGTVFMILDYFTIRNSLTALLIALLLYCLNGVLSIYYWIQLISHDPTAILYIIPAVIWTPFYVMLFCRMWGGIGAIREINLARHEESHRLKINLKQQDKVDKRRS
jgi:hypothetical protein